MFFVAGGTAEKNTPWGGRRVLGIPLDLRRLRDAQSARHTICSDQAADLCPITSNIVSPIADGFGATVIPACDRISTFS